MKPTLAGLLWLGLLAAPPLQAQTLQTQVPVGAATPAEVVEAEGNTVAYQRIDAERASATAGFDAEEVQCYQRFAVSGCLEQVQSRRRAKLADLRRQESMLRAQERVLQAQEQRLNAAQKASERQRQAIALETNNAAARTAEKLRQRDQNRAAHAARATASAAPPVSSPPASGPTPAEQAANRSSYGRKQQEAEKKRLALAKRLADKTGKPAAPLPIPK